MEDTQTSAQTSVSEYVDLTQVIKDALSRVDELKSQASELKEMLDSMFENDSVYMQHDAAVKEAQKTKNNTKKQIMKLPQAKDLVEKVQYIKEQQKEIATSLSDYLQEYQRTTGATEIEDANGEIRQIVYTAKAIKR